MIRRITLIMIVSIVISGSLRIQRYRHKRHLSVTDHLSIAEITALPPLI